MLTRIPEKVKFERCFRARSVHSGAIADSEHAESVDDEDDFVAPQRTPALARIFFCCFFRARVSVIELSDVVAKLLVVALIVSCAYVVDVRFYFSFLSFWCETESNRSRPRLARQKQRRYERRK